MVWYCHQCQSHIEIIHDLKCPDCDGEFVEELSLAEEEEPAGSSGNNPRIIIVRNNVIDRNHPLQAFQAIFGGNNNLFDLNFQRTTSDSSTTTPLDTSQDENNAQPTILDFFNQLIGNLAEGAPPEHRIQFSLGNIGDYASDAGFDNIVTHLLNQFESTGQVDSVSAEDIVNLPMTEVSEKQVENGTQCATCMEAFTLHEKVACLECQHIFHRPCIEPWLRKCNTCPICRKVVDPKQWPSKSIFTDIDELD